MVFVVVYGGFWVFGFRLQGSRFWGFRGSGFRRLRRF